MLIPARVHILQGIIQTIAVLIKALGVGGVGNNRIRADKPPYQRVIVTGIIIVKPGGVKALAGEKDIYTYTNSYRRMSFGVA
jgi:hypothetical protein